MQTNNDLNTLEHGGEPEIIGDATVKPMTEQEIEEFRKLLVKQNKCLDSDIYYVFRMKQIEDFGDITDRASELATTSSWGSTGESHIDNSIIGAPQTNALQGPLQDTPQITTQKQMELIYLRKTLKDGSISVREIFKLPMPIPETIQQMQNLKANMRSPNSYKGNGVSPQSPAHHRNTTINAANRTTSLHRNPSPLHRTPSPLHRTPSPLRGTVLTSSGANHPSFGANHPSSQSLYAVPVKSMGGPSNAARVGAIPTNPGGITGKGSVRPGTANNRCVNQRTKK